MGGDGGESEPPTDSTHLFASSQASPDGRLSRRRYLGALSAAVVASIAGCGGGDVPRPEPPANAKWRFPRGDEHNTAFNDGTDYPATDLSLSYLGGGARVDVAAEEGVVGTPSLAGDRGFVGYRGGRVVGFDVSEGTAEWTTTVDGTIGAGLGVRGNTVIVPTTEGRLFGLDYNSGDVAWTYPSEGPVAGSFTTGPTAGESRVYAETEQPAVAHAVDLADGRRVWRYDLGVARPRGSPPVVGADYLYFASEYAILGLERGNDVQAAAFRIPVRPDGPIVYHAGRLYVVTTEGALAAFDADPDAAPALSQAEARDAARQGLDSGPGSELLLWAEDGLQHHPPIALTGARLLVRVTNTDAGTDGLAAYDTVSGRLLRFGPVDDPGPPTASGGLVYAGTGDGQLRVIDGLSGGDVATKDVGTPFLGGVAVNGNRLVTHTVGQAPAGANDASTVHDDAGAPDPAAGGRRERLLAYDGDSGIDSFDQVRSVLLTLAKRIDDLAVANVEARKQTEAALDDLTKALSNDELGYGLARGTAERVYWSQQLLEFQLAVTRHDDDNKPDMTADDATPLVSDRTEKLERFDDDVKVSVPVLNRDGMAIKTATATVGAVFELLMLAAGGLIDDAASAAKSYGDDLATKAGRYLDDAIDKYIRNNSVLQRLSGLSPDFIDEFATIIKQGWEVLKKLRTMGVERARQYIEQLRETGVLTEKAEKLLRDGIKSVTKHLVKRESGEGGRLRFLTANGVFEFLDGLTNWLAEAMALELRRRWELSGPGATATPPGVGGAYAVSVQQTVDALTDTKLIDRIKRQGDLPGNRQDAGDARAHFGRQLESQAEKFYEELEFLKFEIDPKKADALAETFDKQLGVDGTAEDAVKFVVENVWKGLHVARVFVSPVLNPASKPVRAGWAYQAQAHFYADVNAGVDRVLTGDWEGGV